MDNFEQNSTNPQVPPQAQPQGQMPVQQPYAQPQYKQPQYAQQQMPYGQPQYAQSYAQPQYNPPYGQPAPVAPKKSNYGLISMLVGLLCVVLVFVGIIKTINTAFFNVPIVQFVFEQSGEEDVMDEYDEAIDELENEFKISSDEEIEKAEDAMGMSEDEILDAARNPSINAMIKLGEGVSTGAEVLGEDFDFDNEFITVFKTVRTTVIVYGAVIMFFALLGALLKNRALSITSLVISILFFVALVGVLFLVLYAAAVVAHVILVSKHKKAVRGY